MKTKLFLILFCSVMSLTGFAQNTNKEAKTTDYPSLSEVYDDFVKAIKSDDDEALRQFCYRLAPDEATLQFMRNNQLSYKGIPNQLDQKNLPITAIGDKYFEGLVRVKNRLKQEQLLDKLEHKPTAPYRTETEEVKPGITVEGTEEGMVLKSSEATIHYPIGEMVKVNGKWSLFTRPNTDYSRSN